MDSRLASEAENVLPVSRPTLLVMWTSKKVPMESITGKVYHHAC